MLSAELSEVTLASVEEASRIIAEAHETAAVEIVMRRISLGELEIDSFADSSWNDLPGAKSQGGIIIFATNTSFGTHSKAPALLLDWRSRKSQRVWSSMLQSETCVVTEGLGSALWTREAFRSILLKDYDVRKALIEM